MKQKLIIFDLDGTVLPRLTVLDDRTVETMKAAKAAGHIVCISSARPFAMSKWVYDRMGLDTAISTLNGAHIFHPTDASFPEYDVAISREMTKMIFDFCKENDSFPYYAERGDKLWYIDGIHNDYYRLHIELADPLVKMPEDNDIGTGSARIIVNPATQEIADRLRVIVEETGVLSFTEWHYTPSPDTGKSGVRVSIAPISADKGYAMKHIAKFYGISLEDCYAFGDLWNDFGMLRDAGHGYALKGSQAERESEAKYVTKYTCAECGVADIVEREILGY